MIARRYATAMFAEALKAGDEATLVEEMGVLATAIRENPPLKAALANPLSSRTAKADILTKLAREAKPLTQRALGVLAEGGRAALLPEVADLLHHQLIKHRGELVAIVTSARPLTPAVQQQVKDALKKATGKAVEMQLHEDPAVLGGLSVQLGSLKLDATLAGALTTMRAQMNAPGAAA